MRFSNLFFWVVVSFLLVLFPISSFADDQALIGELTEILTTYEEGMHELLIGVETLRKAQKELTTGLTQSRTELNRLQTAQVELKTELIKSEELIDALHYSLTVYAERTERLTWISVGLGVVAAAAIVIAIFL